MREVLQRVLDDAVLQRVEGDDGKPSTAFQIFLRGIEHRGKLAQLVVDGDADRLKTAFGGVLLLAQRRGGHRAANELRKLERRFNGFLFPLDNDPFRNSGGVALLAVFKENSSQFFIGVSIDDLVRGECSSRVHAHIERRVLLVGKAALCFVELRGGNAEVKEHPVHTVNVQLTQDLSEIAEVAVHERHAVHIVRKAPRRRVDRCLIAVKRDESSRCQAAGDLERVSCATERSIHIDAVRFYLQRVQALLQQHRLMAVVLFHIRTQALPSRQPDFRG